MEKIKPRPLSGSRRLRAVRDEDHEWLVALHNDPLVLRNVTDPTPITLEHHLSWWRGLDLQRQLRFIYEVDGVRAGFVKYYSIDRVNQNCVLGADLEQSFRGQGLARDMWTRMINYAFEELKLHRVSLSTAEFNRRAQHVYHQLGFESEGFLKESLYREGSFHDQLLMYMTRSMWEKRNGPYGPQT